MRIYLAARYSRIGELNSYKSELEARGHEITSRWLMGDRRVNDTALAEMEMAEDIPVVVADKDYQDILAAETVICFTETPRSNHSRGGRHVEFGIGLALGKRLIVIGPRENVFYCLPQVELYSDWAAFRMGRWGEPTPWPRAVQ